MKQEDLRVPHVSFVEREGECRVTISWNGVRAGTYFKTQIQAIVTSIFYVTGPEKVRYVEAFSKYPAVSMGRP